MQKGEAMNEILAAIGESAVLIIRLQEENARLKEQLAKTWQPTASEYPIDGGSSHFSLRIRGNQLAIVLPEEGRIVGIFLPETLRLCEKVQS